jgi:hypothetical protein
MNRLEYQLAKNHKWSDLKLASEPAFAVVTAFNDGYPGVITDPATNIGINKATLNGTLISGFSPPLSACWFEYGETTDYGDTTDHQFIDDGASFSAQVTGLKPNTLYHFRAVTFAGGYGEDKTFRTLVAGNIHIDQLIYQHVERMQR